jgi:hypothetical protein
LSRGFSPVSCPTEPLVSYQLNRQLAGWYLPPLVNRADWAHWEIWVYYSSQQRSINTIDRALILSFGGPLCKSHLLLQM